MQASAAPVAKRSAIACPAPPAYAIAALATAPATHPAAKSRRALSTSARFNRALASVPATNPACTAIVSHAVAEGESDRSAAIAGAAAVAENHSVMPRNWPRAVAASIRRAICRLPGMSVRLAFDATGIRKQGSDGLDGTTRNGEGNPDGTDYTERTGAERHEGRERSRSTRISRTDANGHQKARTPGAP